MHFCNSCCPLKTCCNISTLALSLRSFVYIFSIRIAIKRCKMLLNDDEITIKFFYISEGLKIHFHIQLATICMRSYRKKDSKVYKAEVKTTPYCN